MINAFYSDPHFGHKNICRHAGRPFYSMEEMDRTLIQNYNDIIGKNDTVLWLGDCFLCRVEKFETIMSQLNGRKILVIGNHDKGHARMATLGFDFVLNECVMHIAERTCRINHFPYAMSGHMRNGHTDDRYLDRRPVKNKGELLIHGHTHSKEKTLNNMIHVGVDAWDFKPALYNEIEDLIRIQYPI